MQQRRPAAEDGPTREPAPPSASPAMAPGPAVASASPGIDARIPLGPVSGGGAKSPPASKAAPKKYTEAERVEKHRAVVRRGYYQKKALKAQLRQELGVLEEQYRAVMAQSGSPAPGSPPDASAHCAGCEHAESLRQRFKEQVLATEALRRENETLERRLWRHTDFLDKLQWYLTRQAEEERQSGLPPQPQLPPAAAAAEEEEGEGAAALPPPTTQRASLTTTRRGPRGPLGKQTGPAAGPASFPPLTESECAVIAALAQRDMCSQRRCSGFRDVGPPVMGWNRKHKFGGTSQFSLLKRFHGRRASALAARAWELYATTELLGRLYSRGTNVRFDVLQRVDADNVLLRRVLQPEALARPKTTYFLMARRVATTGSGSDSNSSSSREPAREQQQILFRSVDTERIPTGAAQYDGWLDMFYWLSFDDCGPGEDGQGDGGVPYCEVEFGGHVPCISVADTAFWTMEFLSYILRLENYAVDSVFNINL